MRQLSSGRSDVEIRDLTSDTASRLFSKGADSSLQPAGRIDNIGLYRQDRLIAAIQFGAPRSTNMLLRYSKELYELILLEGPDEDSEYAAQLISYYLRRYKPADICASLDIHPQSASIYSAAGMNLAVNFAGEQVFEWVDPNRTYYTYKITAADSPKSYYGVSHLKIADATEQDCLTDGYWGSGSTRMQEWKAAHESHLKKEIISIHKMRQEAYYAEVELIEESWRADKRNSLNFHIGSILWDGGVTLKSFSIAVCEIHGSTKHMGETCMKCGRLRAISMKICEVHGETKHNGDSCFRCYNGLSTKLRICVIHGEATHQGDVCMRCSAAKVNRIGICETHGETAFKADSCDKCVSAKRVYTAICPTHGEGKFQGESCYKCIQVDYAEGTCELHGIVKLTGGGTCVKCRASKRFYIDSCVTHGETKFGSKGCQKCLGESRISLKDCEIHGLTKHNLDSCYQCRQDSRRRTLELKAKGDFGRDL